ncbi:MAG: diacylglycerol kinase family lipid kinase [Porphyromonadaceae bacterium]|nr:diacylglycerol kinase family lipid kinase [Porphyromonadaceae bacterium]
MPIWVKDNINKDLFDTEIVSTRYAGHATELAQEAARLDYDAVVSVGGDGTCNEIAASLVHTHTALGIIPLGSGNGLARHLGIPLNPIRALQILNDAVVDDIDYCMANDKPFFCTCGMGFDAWVSKKFAEDKHRGKMTYIKKAIEEYLTYKNEVYHIETPDGVIQEKAFLIACGNASQYGNNAYITPRASLHDGKIDVTIMFPVTPFDVLPMTVQLFTKWIDISSNVKTFETPALSITREREGVMHLDGEPVEMSKQIDITCIKGGLKVLIPRVEQHRSLIAPIQSLIFDVVDAIKQELDI